MIDWTDDLEEEIVDMLHVLVKKHCLTSGDISAEDYISLCQIAARYINNNGGEYGQGYIQERAKSKRMC